MRELVGLAPAIIELLAEFVRLIRGKPPAEQERLVRRAILEAGYSALAEEAMSAAVEAVK
jgi:hypothetical protein